jgi:hypothetical protein
MDFHVGHLEMIFRSQAGGGSLGMVVAQKIDNGISRWILSMLQTIFL